MKMVLVNEGFDNIDLKYMGRYWVMIKFHSKEAKKTFQSNVGIGTWFAKIQQASTDLFVEGRVAWVDIEGVPLKMWPDNTFKRIASKWGTLIHVDSHEDGNFYTKRICINTNIISNILESFKIIYRGKLFWVRAKEVSGWELDFMEDNDDDSDNDDDLINDLKKMKNWKKNKRRIQKTLSTYTNFSLRIRRTTTKNSIWKTVLKDKFNEDAAESTCSGHFKKSHISCTGGSILQVMEEMVKETKMENIDLFSIKRCWGNLAFDYAHSAFVGNSDYFVIVRGDWIPNGTKLLIISIYAPQYLSEKKMLWDYLSYVIVLWAGEVVVMGDFNEVRKKDKNFGSVFNVHGSNAFNLFISNAGLEEVPLGGCSYTFCHKSTSKMSKLDRFLISKSLMNSCPNISAITLERFLSDHRPILMRNLIMITVMFHLGSFIIGSKLKVLINLLKILGKKLLKRTLKSDLADLDLIIDKGCGDVEIVNKRANVVRSLQELENLQSLEAAQKSKIKLAIEVDENSKYYHGILNKKRSQLAIRGILVDGNWIDSPHLVKREFLSHFKNRFDHPQDSRLQLDLNFPNTLQHDQIIGLECDVSKDEIKRAVWDCGTDKSLGPDGPDIDHFPILEPFGVEFDVFRNKEFRDINDNHVGVDVNSLTSVNATAARYYDDGDGMFRVLRLNSGENYQVWIDYMDFEINTYPGFVTPGCLIGIMLSPSLQLSHLFYADDVIFMGQWNESNLDTIVQVLECFHSKLMGIYVDADKVTQAARKIGCVTLKTLFTYLGSKVGGHMSRIQSWNETIESMASRLSKWKMKNLSIGGRLTLLKSVLGSMPIYHMSIFKVPMKILQRMESIRSHFFNGSDPLAKKLTWVKWTNVLASKEKGGLGISCNTPKMGRSGIRIRERYFIITLHKT
ncbi:RNA-directed DNA polymerase, eukaryota [Tanacetum coccineum]|uniref:RNA-directed DNA polymerase, eukaryota n=1 Tax=Tanacetum coccineum TaxID=301880 RepID=A0ABQ4Y3N5_9ASTR